MASKKRKYPYYFEGEIKPNNAEIVESGVQEICKALEKYCNKPVDQIKVLDVGSGRGDFAIQLAKTVREIVCIEPFTDAYKHALKRKPKQLTNITFHNSKIEDFKTKDTFDVIIALTIFEHLSDHTAAFNKMFSLLKKGGVIYLTAPNKYWIFEQHYGLPFLAWIPLSLANKYLKTFRNVESYEDSSYSMGYIGMKIFFRKYPCKINFILPFDESSAYYGYGKKGMYSYVKRYGILLIKKYNFFWNFSKGFIVVLKKIK